MNIDDRLPVIFSAPEDHGGPSEPLVSSLAAKRHKKLMSAAHMKRKKWTEEEEETLINKYGELLRSGVLAKLKTRERKFEPIADYVNAMHHAQDPVAFPWEWTWRDSSTKVQNMRHQYLGVKQKIRKNVNQIGNGNQEEYDWEEGVAHWINFLKYKEIFGDVELELNDMVARGSVHVGGNIKNGVGKGRLWFDIKGRNQNFQRGDGGPGMVEGDGGSPFTLCPYGEGRIGHEGENGNDLLAVGFGGLEYDGAGEAEEESEGESSEEDGEKDDDDGLIHRNRKRKKKVERGLVYEARILGFLGAQFAELRDLEMRREERERRREIEMEERAILREEAETQREREREERQREREERERNREKEREEMERLRAGRDWERNLREQDQLEQERHRQRCLEEKRDRAEMEWMESMMNLQMEHHTQLMQLQAQLAQGQQQISALLVGLFGQLSGQGSDLTGQGVSLNPNISQILQSVQQPGVGLVPNSDRREGTNDGQFIVDG